MSAKSNHKSDIHIHSKVTGCLGYDGDAFRDSTNSYLASPTSNLVWQDLMCHIKKTNMNEIWRVKNDKKVIQVWHSQKTKLLDGVLTPSNNLRKEKGLTSAASTGRWWASCLCVTFFLRHLSTWSRRRSAEPWWRFLWTANQPAITCGDSCTQTASKTLPRSSLMLCKCKQLSFLKPPSFRFPPVWRSKGFQSVSVFFSPFSLLILALLSQTTQHNKDDAIKTNNEREGKDKNKRDSSKQGVDERWRAGIWSCETY